MDLISDIFKYIVRYRIHIGVLAAMTAIVPFQSTATGITLDALLAGLAMGMLIISINLSNKLVDADSDATDPRTLPLGPGHHRRLLKISQALFAIPLLWLVFMPPVLVVYVVFGATLGYLFNYGFPNGGKRTRLKSIFLIKNIVPAFSYAMCIAAPYALLAADMVPAVAILHAISGFTMILLHEMMGDMRDMAADKKTGIPTIANKFGLGITKGFAVVVMVAYVAFIFVVTGMPQANLPPLFVIMAAIFLIANAKRRWWYYHLYIFMWLAIVMIDLFV